MLLNSSRKRSASVQAVFYWLILAAAALSLSVPVAISEEGRQRIAEAVAGKWSEQALYAATDAVARTPAAAQPALTYDAFARERVITVERRLVAMEDTLDRVARSVSDIGDKLSARDTGTEATMARVARLEEDFDSITASASVSAPAPTVLPVQPVVLRNAAPQATVPVEQPSSAAKTMPQAPDLIEERGRPHAEAAAIAEPGAIPEAIAATEALEEDAAASASADTATQTASAKTATNDARAAPITSAPPPPAVPPQVTAKAEPARAAPAPGRPLVINSPIASLVVQSQDAAASASPGAIPLPPERPMQLAAAQATAQPAPRAAPGAISAAASTAADQPVSNRTAALQSQVVRTDFAVIVARDTNVQELEKTWARMRARQPEALGRLEPRIRFAPRPDGQGMEMTLLAGPLRNAADAARICSALGPRNDDCRPAIFAGYPLNGQ